MLFLYCISQYVLHLPYKITLHNPRKRKCKSRYTVCVYLFVECSSSLVCSLRFFSLYVEICMLFTRRIMTHLWIHHIVLHHFLHTCTYSSTLKHAIFFLFNTILVRFHNKICSHFQTCNTAVLFFRWVFVTQ